MSASEQVRRAGKIGELLFPEALPFAYQTQRLVCECAWGGGEVTEVARAAERIRGLDFESWLAGWRWLADVAREDGEQAERAGHRVTARDRLFAAANYYRTAGFFLAHDDPRTREISRTMVETFRRAGALWDPPFEPIRWQDRAGRSLPGFVAKPAGDGGPRPTVVYLNGADGTKEESWFLGGAALVARGVTFVGVEGPGQGEPLIEDGVYTEPDYEAAISPLVDELVRRDDVDPDRLGLVGISLGGYYAGRVAAYEPRFRCTALHGACFNVLEDLYEHYLPSHRRLQWVTGTFDDAKARERLKEFDLAPHAGKISHPVFISHGTEDMLVRSEAARNTFEALTVEDKTLRMWGPDGLGGSSHASIDNPTQAYPDLVDWVVDRLTA